VKQTLILVELEGAVIGGEVFNVLVIIGTAGESREFTSIVETQLCLQYLSSTIKGVDSPESHVRNWACNLPSCHPKNCCDQTSGMLVQQDCIAGYS